MPLSFKDIGHGNSKLGKRVTHTTRSGEAHHMGTCPSSCPLLGEHNKEHATDKFDEDYAAALARAVPPKGLAWSYTHWMPAHWRKSGFNMLGRTTMNFSANNWEQAQYVFKNLKVPVVVNLSEEPPKGDAPAMWCPADTMEDMDCSRGGGSKGPICARPDRSFIIMFKQKKWKKTPCYAANGYVKFNWIRTMKNKMKQSDGKRLLKWVSRLGHGTMLRHHVAGDMGKIKGE